MNAGRWVDLVAEASAGRDLLARQRDELALSLLAGEPVTIFGKRVEVTLAWPDGPPFDMAEDELRAYAANWLRESRTRYERWSTTPPSGGERSDSQMNLEGHTDDGH